MANKMTDSLDEKVAEMVVGLRAKGHPIPQTIAAIPEFPCRTFDELQKALESGRLLLQRFSSDFDNSTFSIFATGGERLLAKHYMVGTVLIPIASVILVFMYSWWWLFGIAFLVIGFKKTKSLYNSVILRAAFSSETIFCYLYFIRQVSVSTPDYQQTYYWKSDEAPAVTSVQ